MAKIKVRATKDGHYGGYYRTGPVDSDQGYAPGEVFEIETMPHPMIDPETKKPIPVTDAKGKPVFKKDEKGKVVLGEDGNPVMEIRMITSFSKEWMERVPDDTEVTNDYPEFQAPVQYREKKKPSASKNPVKAIGLGDALKKIEESVI